MTGAGGKWDRHNINVSFSSKPRNLSKLSHYNDRCSLDQYERSGSTQLVGVAYLIATKIG